MDCRPTLEILARLLPVVPNLEDQLVTFDSLVGVSEREHRADAARMLRDAAAGCADEARRERLREAAGAVEAGRPCAFTPEGLSAREAAAQQTITLEEWERRGGDASLPPPPAASVEMEEEDDEDEEADREEEDFLPDAPPALPHLPVRHFFPGLILRVAQAFRDAQGRELQPGERLHLLGCEKNEKGYLLNLLVRTVRLTAGNAEHDRILENAGNAWLAPAPTFDCLRDLCEAVDVDLTEAEEDEERDDDVDRLEKLREEVDACRDWLEGAGGDPPDCKSGGLAARVFGSDHRMNSRVRLLFAGVKVAVRADHRHPER